MSASLGAYFLVGLIVSLFIFWAGKDHPDLDGLSTTRAVMAVLLLSLIWPLVFVKMDDDDGNWRG